MNTFASTFASKPDFNNNPTFIMADHIPFVYTLDDCELVNKVYGDSELVRVPLDRIGKLQPRLKIKAYWLDTAFEGFHHESSRRDNKWSDYINQFPHAQCFDDEAFLGKPLPAQIQAFVDPLLDKAASFHPIWLTVPQFPVHKSQPRNKVNWSLLEAACKWREQTKFKGKFVLPLVITHQDQVKTKTARNKHVEFIKRCFARAQHYLDCIWSVDSSLADQTGTENFRSERFPAIVDLAEEIDKVLPSPLTRISGPYWGMNLVLWARALIDYPAISLGRSYQYRILGIIPPNPPSARLPLAPLRRWVGATPELSTWLKDATARMPAGEPARVEFLRLLKSYPFISNDPLARDEVVRFYKQWFDSIAAHPKSGRALALFQDLSSAYVLGKTLKTLPKSEASTRNPARIAEQLMSNCL